MSELHLTGGTNVDHIIYAPEHNQWPTAPMIYLPDHNVLYEAAVDGAFAYCDLDEADALLLTSPTVLAVWLPGEELCHTVVEFPLPPEPEPAA